MNNYVSISVRTAGHCFAYAHHVIKGEKKRKIRFEATWAIIKHPSRGTGLYYLTLDIHRGFIPLPNIFQILFML